MPDGARPVNDERVRPNRATRLAEAPAVRRERQFVRGDDLVNRGIGRLVLILRAELAVEPAGEIAERLDHRVLGAVGRGLPGRAVALDLDRYRVLVAIVAALPDARRELIEVLALRRLELVRDPVKLFANAKTDRLIRLGTGNTTARTPVSHRLFTAPSTFGYSSNGLPGNHYLSAASRS